eukprot:4958958-Alexandrium_andersonii.AAC.1
MPLEQLPDLCRSRGGVAFAWRQPASNCLNIPNGGRNRLNMRVVVHVTWQILLLTLCGEEEVIG